MHQPNEHDYHYLKRILRYIFGTLGRGLLIRPGTWSFGVSQIQIGRMIKMTTHLHRGFSFFGAEPDLLVYKKTTQGLSVLD